ncbi:MAG TPA: DUF4091 domain-containing protein [Candidatus Hydrogenedentes bacterium]|nr:DUF4091 domain-containing protein [Candidatus Hydrogenedentota bacterium]HPG65659.1 DUF4091 domain-containing protein [Candidatus Hydrogenedentota bacterium]
MITRPLTVVAPLVALLAASLGAAAVVPLVQVGKGPAPTVDGQLDEPIWQSCAQLFPFIQMDAARTAQTPTRAWVFYDDAALYMAFRCDEPAMDQLAAECTMHDDSLWRDDCVEIMLQRPGDDAFAQVIVNTNGATYDARDELHSWEPAIEAAVSKGDDAWIVELSVPWADLGAPPAPDSVWRGNFCRERKVESELSSWSASAGQFVNPVHFGELRFSERAVRLEALAFTAPLPGANGVTVDLALPESVSADLHVTGAASRPVAASAMDIVFPLGVTAEPTVLEARTGDGPVWRAAMPSVITPPPQLERLERSIAAFDEFRGRLASSSPLLDAVKTALTPAVGAAAALRQAIERSLAEHAPMDPDEYLRLNDEAGGQARALGLLWWPVWTKNHWEDVKRDEMPPSLVDLGGITLAPLVNEYESSSFIITNLDREALRLRITASDMTWFPEPDAPRRDLLANGNLDSDENHDGTPDAWSFVSGDRAACQLVEEPNRGRVAAIAGSASGGKLTVRQDVALEGGRAYMLEFRARSERATATVRVGVINSGWTWSRFSTPLSGSSDWSTVRVPVTPPESPTYQVVIWMASGGSGTVWLDDIALYEGGVSSRTFAGTAPELLVADWQELRGGSVVADPLIPLNRAGRLDVPPGESRQIWMTLPRRDMPPGEYACGITAQPLATVALEGAPPGKRITLHVDVQPLHMPTHPDFAVYNWDYALNGGHDLGASYVQDLAEHKVTCFLVATGMGLPAFDDQGRPLGALDLATRDYEIRVKRVYAREAGGQILFSYGIVRDFDRTVHKRYGWEFMSEPWITAFRWAYAQWIDHVKALGLDYDDFCVQVWDEATGPEARRVVECGPLLREVDPRVRLVMDGAQNVDEVRAMDPYIDVWIPHLTQLENPQNGPALLKTYKGLGKPVYTYTCSVQMKALSPYTYHRLKPWQAARLGLNGVFYWDYNSWRGDPWNDFDGEIADCGVVYTGVDGPITSRRWEASREGIEDWQIMGLLEGLAASDEASAAEAKTIVDEALETVLARKNEPDLADRYRATLVEAAVTLGQARPLEIIAPVESLQDGALHLSFTTTWPAQGQVLFRIQGEREWNRADVAEETMHKVAIPLPPHAEADWVLVLWDSLGRVASAAHRIG